MFEQDERTLEDMEKDVLPEVRQSVTQQTSSVLIQQKLIEKSQQTYYLCFNSSNPETSPVHHLFVMKNLYKTLFMIKDNIF